MSIEFNSLVKLNFTVKELTESATARRLGIDNTLPRVLIGELTATAEMLQRIRNFFGTSVFVSSGYRCEALNLAIGGVTSSDHCRAAAADILVPRAGTPFEVAKALSDPRVMFNLGIGQLIYETTEKSQWVHVSREVPDVLINRILTYKGGKYLPGIVE